MDITEMKGAGTDPAPSEDGAPAAPSQPPEEAITAALVQSTANAMSYMRQAMKAAGHAPPGV